MPTNETTSISANVYDCHRNLISQSIGSNNCIDWYFAPIICQPQIDCLYGNVYYIEVYSTCSHCLLVLVYD